MYPEHCPTNRFVSLLGVPVVCRWELGRATTSWSVLANVELCLYLLHALLLPQHVAVLIFSWTLPWHWYHMSYCLVRRDVYFKYPDLISLYWWQAENKRLVLSCCAFSDLSSLFSQYLLSSLLSLLSWRNNWGVSQLEGKALRNAVLLDTRDSMWESVKAENMGEAPLRA